MTYMNEGYEIIKITRDVEGQLIPTGVLIDLEKDTEVTIFQSLGDSYTVNVNGNLVRIAGKDGDALGKEKKVEIKLVNSPETPEGAVDDELLMNQLRLVYDPEIPVNIFDLGLVYSCKVVPQKPFDNHIEIVMTLTAPGCGMGDVIINEVRDKLMQVPSVTQVNVTMTFDPAWDRSMMSEEAKLTLGMF